jgi:hypothetical protein
MNKQAWIGRVLSAAVVVAAGAVASQSALAANDMASLSWLAGVWQTAVTDGAQTQYVYTPVANGQMISTMFAIKNGEATRYELRVIKMEGDKAVFRELAFKPDLTPGAPVPERPLESADKDVLTFVDMKVTRVGPDDIKMALTAHPANGPAQTRDVDLHRVYRFAKVQAKKD